MILAQIARWAASGEKRRLRPHTLRDVFRIIAWTFLTENGEGRGTETWF